MKNRVDGVAFALLLGLFGLWLVGLSWIHMRPDEQLVYQHTGGSLFDTVAYQARQDVQAPMWHAFFWGWRNLTGETEFAGRYQGVLLSSITLSLVYLLARSWFGARRSGWFAMLGVGLNAYFFTYAFEIRPYPLVILVATASTWAMWRWLKHQTPRTAVLYGLTLAWMGYVHYFMAFLVAVQMLYISMQRPLWRQLGLALLVGLIVWSPWLHTFTLQVRSLFEITGDVGISSTAIPTTWPTIWTLATLATNGLFWAWVAVLLAGAFLVRRREYVFLLLWSVGAVALAFFVNQFAFVYAPRYLSYAAVGLGIAAGVAFASLRPRYALILFAVFSAANAVRLPGQMPDRIPYRTIFTDMTSASRRDDVVFFDQTEIDGSFVGWQADLYLGSHLQANRVGAVSQIGAARRVWHVTNAWFADGVQGRFAEIEVDRPLQVVLGQCDTRWCFLAQLLEGPPSWEPLVVFGDTLPFYGADITTADERINARLWWEVDTPPESDLSISLQLLDEAGALVVQNDGPINDLYEGALQTSQMQPGRVTIDVRQLEIPSMSGNYALVLLVYDPMTGERLLLADDAEQHLVQPISVP